MTLCSPAGCTGSPLSSRPQVGVPLAKEEQGLESGICRWVGSAVGNKPPPAGVSGPLACLRGDHRAG